jgi:trans-aconitate 2-methyltransferase
MAPENRSRAAHDFMCCIPVRAPRRIADVYAGQGSMGLLLAQQFPDAEIDAFDLSHSGERVAERRLERFLGRSSGNSFPTALKNFDLIFLTGSLDLLPSLPRLLPGLVEMLDANGWLAVQIPNDLYEPSRALVRMIAADGPWARKLLPIAKTRPFNESMEGLYTLLSPICAAVDVWEAAYLHAMSSIATIVELMEATSLAPFLAPLDPTDRRKFLARYAAELDEAYPTQPDGSVLLRFRRLFVLAQS